MSYNFFHSLIILYLFSIDKEKQKVGHVFTLDFVSRQLQTGFCPHYFIPSVNLWGAQVIGKKAEKVPSQGQLGCKIIKNTMRSHIRTTIIPNIFLCDVFLDHVYSLPSTQFYPLAIILVVLCECVVVPSLPALCLAIVVTIQTMVSWLLGSITCLPIFIIYITILLATKYIMTHFY